MKPQKKAKIVQLDADTGEILAGAVAFVPARHYFKENHLTMFQDALKKKAKLKLTGTASRVLDLLMAVMGMGNVAIISFTEIGKELDLKPSAVSRAIKELELRNVIIKGEKKVGNTPTIRINNTLVWKGKVKDYKMQNFDYPISHKKTKIIDVFDPK